MAGLITFDSSLDRTLWMRRLMQLGLLGDRGCGVSHAPVPHLLTTRAVDLISIKDEQCAQHHGTRPNVGNEASVPEFTIGSEFEQCHAQANDHDQKCSCSIAIAAFCAPSDIRDFPSCAEIESSVLLLSNWGRARSRHATRNAAKGSRWRMHSRSRLLGLDGDPLSGFTVRLSRASRSAVQSQQFVV
jgi:hypothetical protein